MKNKTIDIRNSGNNLRYNINIPSQKEQKLRSHNRKLTKDLIPGLVEMMNGGKEDVKLAWAIISKCKVDKNFQKLINTLVENRVYNSEVSSYPPYDGRDITTGIKWRKCKRSNDYELGSYNYNKYKIIRDFKG